MLIGNTYVVLALGEITQELADVIVIPSPSGGSIPAGEAAITAPGPLPARYVVHAAGPAWRGGTAGEAEQLYRAYANCLGLAAEYGATTIALPPVSPGYPREQAAPVALGAARDFACTNQRFREIRYVLATERDLAAYRQALGALTLRPPASLANTGS